MSIYKHVLEHTIMGLPTEGVPSEQDLENKTRYWAYQTFTQAYTSPNVITLSQNDNATTAEVLASSLSTIVDSSAVLSDANGKPLFTTTILIINLNQVGVTSQVGTSVILDKSFGSKTFRVWYLLYGHKPTGAQDAPKFVVQNMVDFLEATFVDQYGDTMYGDLSVQGSVSGQSCTIGDNSNRTAFDTTGKMSMAGLRELGGMSLPISLD